MRQLRLDAAELDAVVERARRELAERLARYYASAPAAGGRRTNGAARRRRLGDRSQRAGGRALAARARRGARDPGGAGRCPGVSARVAQVGRRGGVRARAPADLWAIGLWYEDFSPTSEEEVAALLAEPTGAVAREVAIEAAPGIVLSGDLTVPWGAYARGVVAFAHGSGSSRLSPRNRQVARLSERGRLRHAAVRSADPTRGGRSRERVRRPAAGAAARGGDALVAPSARDGSPARSATSARAPARRPRCSPRPSCRRGVCAVVSRGGRPDLARAAPGEVVAPVLLIVGGADTAVLELNREAQRRMACENELAVVPGATHLFEEPGALDRVARLAIDWFTQHLGEGAPTPRPRRSARLSCRRLWPWASAEVRGERSPPTNARPPARR